MKLLECYIENFGKINKQKFSFKDGLNCIKEDNGSGKSTLAAFIKVMLYGMSESKKANLDENERKHYLPWQGGICGGWLIFSTDDKTYRVERSFGAKASDDKFALYDTATGRELGDFEEGLGKWLFGIDADGFERTVFLSERALTTRSDNKSISAKLSDLVGCDGDIGGMDDAMDTLEEQRKFYYKKGGSGEIADTKAKIDEINRKIEHLEQTETALKNTRESMTAIAKKIEKTQKESTSLMKQREELTLHLAQNNHERRYDEIKRTLDELTKKRASMGEIFGEQVPSFSEIDEASFKNNEAKSLASSVDDMIENPEFTRLASRFKDKVDGAMIDRARVSLARAKESAEKKKDPNYARARKVFSGRIPSDEEIDKIDELIRNGKNKLNAFYILMLIVGIALCFVGIAISMIPLSVIGIGVMAVGIAIMSAASSRQKKKRNDRISLFFKDVSDVDIRDNNEALARINDMRALLKFAIIESESTSYGLDELISYFPETVGDHISRAEHIIREYERYCEVAATERYIKTDIASKTQRAERLRLEVAEFLGRFDLKTPDPFSELRVALNEYNRLGAEILAKRGDLERLESLNAIGEGAQKKTEVELREIDARRKQLDEELATLSREYTLAERASRNYADELDSRHDLLMKKSELEELLAKHTDNYNTILLTKHYITLAKDNITAKYLGKTKAGFLRYAETIGGISGENFEMNTEFGITKQEGTSSKTPDAYSRGTRDLFNLASRLALVDSLYENERPFIILDDPFTALDDKKVDAALKLIKEFSKEKQIIYFTCSKSRCI